VRMARPPRAKSFEYLGFYRYLVTAGTCDRRPWFGDAQCARPIASQIPRFFGALEFDVVYILQNPVRAGLVKRAGDYPWTGSARFTIAELAEHAANWRPSWK